jgi:transposase
MHVLAYLRATAQAASQAQIVHDKFDVARHLNEPVDQVRRAENRQLHRQVGRGRA